MAKKRWSPWMKVGLVAAALGAGFFLLRPGTAKAAPKPNFPVPPVPNLPPPPMAGAGNNFLGPAVVTNPDGLAMRQSPNVGAPLIRPVLRGENVVVVENNGAGWVRLQGGGWVCSTCPELPATPKGSPPWVRPR